MSSRRSARCSRASANLLGAVSQALAVVGYELALVELPLVSARPICSGAARSCLVLRLVAFVGPRAAALVARVSKMAWAEERATRRKRGFRLIRSAFARVSAWIARVAAVTSRASATRSRSRAASARSDGGAAASSSSALGSEAGSLSTCATCTPPSCRLARNKPFGFSPELAAELLPPLPHLAASQSALLSAARLSAAYLGYGVKTFTREGTIRRASGWKT